MARECSGSQEGSSKARKERRQRPRIEWRPVHCLNASLSLGAAASPAASPSDNGLLLLHPALPAAGCQRWGRGALTAAAAVAANGAGRCAASSAPWLPPMLGCLPTGATSSGGFYCVLRLGRIPGRKWWRARMSLSLPAAAALPSCTPNRRRCRQPIMLEGGIPTASCW